MNHWLLAIICGQAVLYAYKVRQIRGLRRRLEVAARVIVELRHRLGYGVETGEPLKTVLRKMREEKAMGDTA